MAIKIAIRTQTLLGLDRLDPWIQVELEENQGEEICPIDISGLDFIDELLQANRTSPTLQEYREKAKDTKTHWKLRDNGLITHQERLVIPSEGNLRTRLIAEVHSQISTAHPGKNKTRKIIGDRYYWPGMTANID
jgi:hypothetical protein